MHRDYTAGKIIEAPPHFGGKSLGYFFRWRLSVETTWTPWRHSTGAEKKRTVKNAWRHRWRH